MSVLKWTAVRLISRVLLCRSTAGNFDCLKQSLLLKCWMSSSSAGFTVCWLAMHGETHILAESTEQWLVITFVEKTNTLSLGHVIIGSGKSSVVEHQTHDRKVVGLSPSRNGWRIFFSRVNFLCWLLCPYLFHPHVTTVAHKRTQSFCQKCMWWLQLNTCAPH